MALRKIAVLFVLPMCLFGVTKNWMGTTSGDWNNIANWCDGGVFPNNIDDIATLLNGCPGPPTFLTINLNVPIIIGELDIDFGTAYTVDIPGSFIFQVSSGNAEINIGSTHGAAAHSIKAPILMNSSLVIDQTSDSAFTISGSISGAQSLTKIGSGSLVLSGGNTYTGGTIITEGTVSIASDANLGGAGQNVTIGNATLEFTASTGSALNYNLSSTASIEVVNGGDTVTISTSIAGPGSLTKIGAGTLVLSAANTYAAGTNINAGTLSISNDNQLGAAPGTLNISNATLLTTAGITSARSGTFTGNATINTGGNTDTFTGNFSGTGGLTIAGNGTVVLVGSNSYSGGTTILTGSTLSGNTNGIQGNISANPGSFLTFNQNFNGTYSGVIVGSGTLTKTGSGTVQFNGLSPGFTGAANVTGGKLFVNGSLANASLITVSAGAGIGGSGVIGPTNNSGTIEPGSPGNIGNLSVNGNLTLNGTSDVIIQIAPTTSDSISVSGTATLAGDLTIDPQPGFYAIDTCYTILTSGLRVGTFNPPTSTSSNFTPTVSYPGNNVVVCVHVINPFFQFPFSNRNTRSVGNNLTALVAAGQLTPALSNLLNQFVGQNFGAINAALDQLHPAPFSAFTQIQEEADPMIASLFHHYPYVPSGCGGPNHFWFKPFFNSLTQDHHGMQFGFTGNTGGFALGVERELCEVVLGIGGAWTDTHVHWEHHSRTGLVHGLFGAVYCDYLRDNFYLGTTLLAGEDFFHTERHLRFFTTDEIAKGHFTGLDLDAQLQMAYFFGVMDAGLFYPYANLDLLYLKTQSFTENGAGGLDLQVRSRQDLTLRSELGLAVQIIDTNWDESISIIPLFSLGWVHMHPIKRDPFTANFVGTTIPFKTYGWDNKWNLISLDFGLSFVYRYFSLGLEYHIDVEPSDKELFDQNGTMRLDWKW